MDAMIIQQESLFPQPQCSHILSGRKEIFNNASQYYETECRLQCL